MKHRALLERIRQAARDYELIWSEHALDEMDAEGETRRSVAAVLCQAQTVFSQPNGRFRVRSEGLVVILEIDGTTIRVCTVYAAG